jgi:hypothetical protein
MDQVFMVLMAAIEKVWSESDSCSYRGAIGIRKASKVSIFVYLRKLSEEQSGRLFRALISRWNSLILIGNS